MDCPAREVASDRTMPRKQAAVQLLDSKVGLSVQV